MRVLTIISFILLVLCMGMCIYDAYRQNMFCVVWALNALINFINIKSVKE